MDFRNLKAVLLSHLHSDHISDLLVMRYALQLKKCPPMPLYLPATPENMFDIFAAEKSFATTVIKDGMHITVAGVHVEFCRMAHSVESYAVRLQSGSKTFVYSGDTSLNDDLAAFARNADLLLIDAQFSNENLPFHPPHLSAAQAAQIAKKAGIKRLLLTHINPEQNEKTLLAQAKEIFKHSDIAVENREYNI